MTINILIPGLSLRSNRWAEISERLRRNFKLMHYRYHRPTIIESDQNTPKAFANFSPGLERSDNPG